MTREEFERLPALITRAAFKQLTGLSDEDLARMCKRGEIRVCKANGDHGYAKYYKADAERFAFGVAMPERIVAGDYALHNKGAGKYWLGRRGGEGMETTEEKVAGMLHAFFCKEF